MSPASRPALHTPRARPRETTERRNDVDATADLLSVESGSRLDRSLPGTNMPLTSRAVRHRRTGDLAWPNDHHSCGTAPGSHRTSLHARMTCATLSVADCQRQSPPSPNGNGRPTGRPAIDR